jgi:hypothetical protein
MAEAAIAAAGDRELRARGAYIINIHNAGYGRTGVTDRVAVYRGVALIFDYKTATGRLSRIQAYELTRAARAGAVTFIARSRADVAAQLDAIDRRFNPTAQEPS